MKWVLTMPGDRDPAARELLHDHRVGREVEPHPAVLLRDRHTEQPELLHLLHDRLGELVLVVVLLGDRENLVVHELPDHLRDGPLLVGLLGEGAGGYGHGLRRAPVSLTGESTKDTRGLCGKHAGAGSGLVVAARVAGHEASDVRSVFDQRGPVPGPGASGSRSEVSKRRPATTT